MDLTQVRGVVRLTIQVRQACPMSSSGEIIHERLKNTTVVTGKG